MSTATVTAPKPPKRVLPANLGKTANAVSKINSALTEPEAIKVLGILATGEAEIAELAKVIKTNDLLIGDVLNWLLKAKLVAKVKAGTKAPASYVLTESGSKVWSAIQALVS
jgi:DNA-binding HxlR family transcriptional regulator